MVAHRRAVTLAGQSAGNLIIRHPGAGHFQNARLHLAAARQSVQIANGNLNLHLARRAAPPDDPDRDAVRRAAMSDNLVDQTAQQRLLALGTQRWVLPQRWQAASGLQKSTSGIGTDLDRAGTGRLALREAFLSLMQLAQSRFPPALQLSGDIAVIRIDLVELALGQASLVAQPFDLLSLAAGHGLLSLPLGSLGSLPDLQFRWGGSLEESLDDPSVDRVGGQALTNRHAMLLAQIIADVTRPGFVLHHHLVPALAAIDEAVEQGGARAGYAAGLVAVVLCVVVAQHRLDLVKRFPGDVGRILVLHDKPPLLARPRLLHGPGSGQRRPRCPGAAVDGRAAICRVLQHGDDGGNGWRLPPDAAVAVPSRQGQAAALEGAQGPGRRLLFQEGGEDERHPGLHLLVRILGHDPRGIAHQTGGQDQPEVAACRLAVQTGGQAAAQGMEFDLGDGALQTQKEPAVLASRIVNTVAVRDQTLAIAAQVEQRVPVRAVTRQPGHLPGQDQADLAQGDAADQIHHTLAVTGGLGAEPEIGIDDLDVVVMPAEFEGALAQGVLQARALLVAQDLVRCGLADVDHGLAAEVPGRYVL